MKCYRHGPVPSRYHDVRPLLQLSVGSAMADDGDDDKTTLAQQIFGRGAAVLGRKPLEPKANENVEAAIPSAAARSFPGSESSTPAASKLEAGEDAVPQKQLKTAAELAEMIERDLAGHPDCPKAGFRVTVYGWPAWRAMLTITPAAGAVRNPQEWRDLTSELADRLRKRYDLAWEQSGSRKTSRPNAKQSNFAN
jgi:hypothetical protein